MGGGHGLLSRLTFTLTAVGVERNRADRRRATLCGTARSIGAIIKGCRMNTVEDLQAKFWKALHADRTMMLGLDGVEGGHARPMTAQAEGDHGPLWFFTSAENGIVEHLGAGDRAVATFVDKGHHLFATLHGTLALDNDPATIERLWNPFIAAWYEGGKTDPTLRLLRLEAHSAEIWVNDSSVFAGLKMLLGADPKADYVGKVATVSLD
jgi:general stress protein 26